MSGTTPDGLLFAEVIDWLVEHAEEVLADCPFPVTVEDGTGLSMNTGAFVHVGTGDPLSTSIEGAADVDQEWTTATQAARSETGSVVLCVEAHDDGIEGGQKRCRDQVVEIGRRLLRMIRRDTRMGIDGMVKTSCGDINFDQGPTDTGVGALLVIHVRYDARILGGLQ